MTNPDFRKVYDSAVAHLEHEVDINVYDAVEGEKWLGINQGIPVKDRFSSFTHDYDLNLRGLIPGRAAERLSLAPSIVRKATPPTQREIIGRAPHSNRLLRSLGRTMTTKHVEPIYNPSQILPDVRRDILSGEQVPFSQIAYSLGSGAHGNVIRAQQRLVILSHIPTAIGKQLIAAGQAEPTIVRSLALEVRDHVLKAHKTSANMPPYDALPEDWPIAFASKSTHEDRSRFDITFAVAGSATQVEWPLLGMAEPTTDNEPHPLASTWRMSGEL